MKSSASALADIVRTHEGAILDEWVGEQQKSLSRSRDKMSDADLRSDCSRFLGAFNDSVAAGGTDVMADGWKGTRDALAEITAVRARKGFTSSETAGFIFSMKPPLFSRLRHELGSRPAELADQTSAAGNLLDRLALHAMELYQRSREEVIMRQQRELLELSTPVVELWDNILALPLIGTLDSGRTQVVMESLLQKIVESGASIAIIDITGVPTVDTLVAQHLMKTVAAARLMGADCIISGIRPQIAQTIVHLGVDLSAVTTKASLADAFRLALSRTGAKLVTEGKVEKPDKSAKSNGAAAGAE